MQWDCRNIIIGLLVAVLIAPINAYGVEKEMFTILVSHSGLERSFIVIKRGRQDSVGEVRGLGWKFSSLSYLRSCLGALRRLIAILVDVSWYLYKVVLSGSMVAQ